MEVNFITQQGPAQRAEYYPIFVSDKKGITVGRVFLYIIGVNPEHRCYAYIDDLSVIESMRGQGIGRMLMERAHEIAREKRCYKIVANSHRKRKSARALYASLGYRPHGREFRMDLVT